MSKENDTFTSRTIVDKFDIPMHRLRMWLIEGFIEATYPSGGTQGKRAYFTRGDIYGICLFVKLIGKGFQRELAAKYVKEFRKVPEFADKVPYILLVTVEKEDGELVIEPRSYMGNPFMLQAEPDKISLGADGGDKDKCEWHDFFVINYARLRRDVDEILDS